MNNNDIQTNLRTDIQTTVEVQGTADFTDWGIQAMDSAGFWMPIALIATLCAMQIVKAGFKMLVPYKFRNIRKWATFLVAYVVGVQVGLFFLEGPDSAKWAAVIGIINPFVYIGLKTVAKNRRWAWLLSVLKMRDVKINPDTGELEYDKTQIFMVGRSDE